MTSSRLETLSFCLQNVLADKLVSMSERLGELRSSVCAGDLLQVMETLRDHPDLRFEILIDLCGVDYSAYGAGVCLRGATGRGQRFAVVYHLLSHRS